MFARCPIWPGAPPNPPSLCWEDKRKSTTPARSSQATRNWYLYNSSSDHDEPARVRSACHLDKHDTKSEQRSPEEFYVVHCQAAIKPWITSSIRKTGIEIE